MNGMDLKGSVCVHCATSDPVHALLHRVEDASLGVSEVHVATIFRFGVRGLSRLFSDLFQQIHGVGGRKLPPCPGQSLPPHFPLLCLYLFLFHLPSVLRFSPLFVFRSSTHFQTENMNFIFSYFIIFVSFCSFCFVILFSLSYSLLPFSFHCSFSFSPPPSYSSSPSSPSQLYLFCISNLHSPLR